MLPLDIIQFIFEHVPAHQRWKFARLCKYCHQRSSRDPVVHRYYTSYTLAILDLGRYYRKPSTWRWKPAKGVQLSSMMYFYFLQGFFACPYRGYLDRTMKISSECLLFDYIRGAMCGGTSVHYRRIEDALVFLCDIRIGMRIYHYHHDDSTIRRQINNTRRRTTREMVIKLQRSGAFVCCGELCEHLLGDRGPYHIPECDVCFRSLAGKSDHLAHPYSFLNMFEAIDPRLALPMAALPYGERQIMMQFKDIQ